MRIVFCFLILFSCGMVSAQPVAPVAAKPKLAIGKKGFLSWEAEAAFELPIQFGGKIKLRAQNNVYGVVGLGFAPQFLTTALGSFAGNTGGIGKEMGIVIGDSLQNSFVADMRIGWAFQGIEGLYIEGGYLMMTSAGGKTDVRNLETALGYVPLLSDTSKATVDATIHAMTAHVGYSIAADESILVSAEVGLMKPVAVASNFKIDDPLAPITAESRRKEAQTQMDKAITSKMFVPTLGIRLVYLF